MKLKPSISLQRQESSSNRKTKVATSAPVSDYTETSTDKIKQEVLEEWNKGKREPNPDFEKCRTLTEEEQNRYGIKKDYPRCPTCPFHDDCYKGEFIERDLTDEEKAEIAISKTRSEMGDAPPVTPAEVKNIKRRVLNKAGNYDELLGLAITEGYKIGQGLKGGKVEETKAVSLARATAFEEVFVEIEKNASMVKWSCGSHYDATKEDYMELWIDRIVWENLKQKFKR